MAVTREMVLVRLEDLAPYAEARALQRRVEELGRDAPGEPGLGELALAARAVAATVAEALRAGRCHDEIRRLRDAALALGELRAAAWAALAAGALAARAFDEVMASAARCQRDVARVEAASRHRGRRRVDLGDEGWTPDAGEDGEE